MSLTSRLVAWGNSLWIEWRIALRFLADNPLQTLLISVAISVGAAVIVFITALMTGLQNNVIEKTLGTQAHIRIEARGRSACKPLITGKKCAMPWINIPV